MSEITITAVLLHHLWCEHLKILGMEHMYVHRLPSKNFTS